MTYTSLGVQILDGQKKSAKVFRQFRLSCRELQTATPYVSVFALDVAKKLVCTLNLYSSRYISAWFVFYTPKIDRQVCKAICQKAIGLYFDGLKSDL